VEPEPPRRLTSRLRRGWERVADAVSWTRPTSTEFGTVAKAALAAGLAWGLAVTFTDATAAVVAALTAVVVVQVNVRASVRTALQRSAAVVTGVLTALAIGEALSLNAFTVALVVGVTLGLTQLVLRLPAAAARQVPISVLVVLTAVAASPNQLGWRRAGETLIGATVGVVMSLALPASRLVDGRQTIQRLGDGVCGVLQSMALGLQEPWSTDQTRAWRRVSHTVRDRLVDQAREAVGDGRNAARWNIRDRRHLTELGRYEDAMPCLERTAIGVWAIARGLDDHARLRNEPHGAMPAMGALFASLAAAIAEYVRSILGASQDAAVVATLDEVHTRRERCMQGAARRARLALESEAGEDHPEVEGEWIGYVSLLVQADRIAADIRANLSPTD
jgi:Fusaric acid resistance protein-like